MSITYFKDLHAQTESRFWINNPTTEESALALENDAFSCTTNPAYCSRLISVDPDYINAIIDEQILLHKEHIDVANAVYRICGKNLMDAFLPIYEATGGTKGFVTMQDDPRYDGDADHIIASVLENRKLAPNCMAKIPVINGGIEAIQMCVQYNIPVCATEVFAISQALCIAEAYEAAAKKYGNRHLMFITHISGIFDEYLKKTAHRRKIDIPDEIISQAGVAIARKQYKVLSERGFHFTMLGGGARSMFNFTGLIGGPHITINWSTAQEIIDADIPVKELVSEETPREVLEILQANFEDFSKAYSLNGLSSEEFADFGPVQLFRNAFLTGWYHLLMQIALRKHLFAI